jgi:hypothetical protein
MTLTFHLYLLDVQKVPNIRTTFHIMTLTFHLYLLDVQKVPQTLGQHFTL